MNIALQKIARRKRHQPLVADALAAPDRIGRRDRPLAGLLHQSRRVDIRTEERGEVAIQRFHQPLQHGQRWRHLAVFDLGDHAFGTANAFGQFPDANALEQPGMFQPRPDLQFVPLGPGLVHDHSFQLWANGRTNSLL